MLSVFHRDSSPLEEKGDKLRRWAEAKNKSRHQVLSNQQPVSSNKHPKSRIQNQSSIHLALGETSITKCVNYVTLFRNYIILFSTGSLTFTRTILYKLKIYNHANFNYSYRHCCRRCYTLVGKQLHSHAAHH